jgi:hypothetical protein
VPENAVIGSPSVELFSNVAPDYAHVEKIMQPAAALIAPGLYQKWYLVHPPERQFSAGDIADAQDFMRAEVEGGRLALLNEVGFTVQHRCASVDIFYVCSWRGNNELWESIYHRPHGGQFTLAQRPTKTATYCVWVIPAVMHEQRAWLVYLRSRRDDAARRAYCNDQVSGPVG